MTIEKIKYNQFAPFHAIRKVFNLTKKQTELLQQLYLIKGEWVCINNLVLELNTNRSQIQKYLLRLKKKGLVKRKKISLNDFHEQCKIHNRENMATSNNRGSLYLYSPIDPQNLIEKFNKNMEIWQNSIERFFKTNF